MQSPAPIEESRIARAIRPRKRNEHAVDELTARERWAIDEDLACFGRN